MKRLSGRFTVRRLIAVAVAGALPAVGLGVVGASAADRGADAPPATKVPMTPCALKYASGSLYVGASNDVYKVSRQTGTAITVAPGFAFAGQAFAQACGVAVDGVGNVLVADGGAVVAVAAKTGTFYGLKMTAGRVYPLVADLQPSTAVDVQLDPAGNVVIATGGSEASSTDNETDSQVRVLAQRTGTFYGQKMTKGRLYVIAGVLNGQGIWPPCEDSASRAAAQAGTKATGTDLGYQIGTLRFDADGNIILADVGGDTEGPCGGSEGPVHSRVDVIPARAGTFYGQKMTVGDIYPIAGLGTKTGNGVPAIDSNLQAAAVALDHDGNILVATGETGHPNAAVVVIAAKTGAFYGQKMIKGDIYSVVRSFPGDNSVSSVAVDNAGNVLAGEQYQVEMLAEKTGDYYGVKARAGHLYTIAGTGSYPV